MIWKRRAVITTCKQNTFCIGYSFNSGLPFSSLLRGFQGSLLQWILTVHDISQWDIVVYFQLPSIWGHAQMYEGFSLLLVIFFHHGGSSSTVTSFLGAILRLLLLVLLPLDSVDVAGNSGHVWHSAWVLYGGCWLQITPRELLLLLFYF